MVTRFLAAPEGAGCVQLGTGRVVVAKTATAGGVAVPPSLGHVPQGVEHFYLGPKRHLNAHFEVWGCRFCITIQCQFTSLVKSAVAELVFHFQDMMPEDHVLTSSFEERPDH